MKIVILDGCSINSRVLSWKELDKYGDVVVYDRSIGIDESKIIEHISNAEVIFINETIIQADFLSACKKLKFIGLISTDYNVVELDTAIKKGVIIASIPDFESKTVTQFAIALLLETINRIGRHNRAVKAGCY